ncbi:MAG: lytic transglycosylase domain-containing protein [Bacillota bacterium]
MEVSAIFRLGCLLKIVIILIVLTIIFGGLFNSEWFLKIFYPQPHQEIVKDAAIKYNVDYYLILAVMKVESKFDSQAQSTKGARGLMQIMPDTAQWIATKELSLKEFQQDMLFEPQYNIPIGTWYLNYLVKQFKGNTIAAVAAYNGGETNVKKWLANGIWSGSFNDLKDIPFKETRNYVYKVIMDYNTYQSLYVK